MKVKFQGTYLDITKKVDYIRQVLDQEYLSFDIETFGGGLFLDKLQMLSYDWNGEKKGYWIKGQKMPDWLQRKLADPSVLKIIHSSQFDIPTWRMITGVHIRNVWDTQLIEKVILGGVGNVWTDTALANTVKRRYKIFMEKDTRDTFIGYEGPITKRQIKYGLKDIKYLRKLMLDQIKDLEDDGLVEVARLENRTAEVTGEMRFNGIGFDEQFWIDLAEKNLAEYQRLVSKMPKEVRNWNSPPQIKKYFAEFHDIHIESLSKLHRVKLNGPCKEFEQLKELRTFYSSVSTFGLGFLFRDKKRTIRVLDGDGRIRPSFDQIIETGRYSCSKPNLQNQPSDGLHRIAYVARKGWKFVIGDFTGQELALIAVASGDPVWLNGMRKRHDIHSVMAAKVFSEWRDIGEPDCKFPFKCDCPEHKKKRRPAKDLNFGLAYGQGWEAFAEKSGLGKRQGKRIYDKYKRVNPKVTRTLDKNGRLAIKRGYSRTLAPFRRIRYLQGEKWRVRNQGKNSPIQGSGADMTKLALCMMFEYIYDNGLENKVRIVLTVHDEIICEVKDSFTKQWAKIMKMCMEQAAMVITKEDLTPVEPEIVERWKPKDMDKKEFEKLCNELR